MCKFTPLEFETSRDTRPVACIAVSVNLLHWSLKLRLIGIGFIRLMCKFTPLEFETVSRLDDDVRYGFGVNLLHWSLKRYKY